MGKKRRRKKSKLPFDLGSNPILVLLSVVTLALTLVALILETGLSWGCVGASVVATAGWKKWDERRQKKIPKSNRRPKRGDTPPPKRPVEKPPPGQRGPTKPKEIIRCTATGKDVEVCECYSRHIRKVPNQYKKPLGTPYGTPGKGGQKPPEPVRPPEPAEQGGA
jgi:hypothetical protein